MPTHIAVVANGKPWISNDDGNTWTELSTFPTKYYMGVGYDPYTSTYWFSVYSEGIFKSTDLVNFVPVFTDIGTRRLNFLACNNGRISVASEIVDGISGKYFYSSDNGNTFTLQRTPDSNEGASQTYGCCYDLDYPGGARQIMSGALFPTSGILSAGPIGGYISTTNIFQNFSNLAHRGVAVIDNKLYYCLQGSYITHASRNGWQFNTLERTATTKAVRQAAKTNSGRILVTCSDERIAYFDPVAHTFSDTSSPIKNWRMVAYIDNSNPLNLYVNNGVWKKVSEQHQIDGDWVKASQIFVPSSGAWVQS